jgi:hypothetical protein
MVRITVKAATRPYYMKAQVRPCDFKNEEARLGGRGQRRDGQAEKRLVVALRAGWCRKWPTASPKQPGFLRLRARGNDAAWRRATCDGGRRQRAMEAKGRRKQKAANCVAQTARPSQAQGEGQ